MTTSVDTIDATSERARPVELYEFSYGTNTFSYCTGGENLVIAGRYYKAISAIRKAYTHTDNLLKGGLKIQLDIQSDVGRLAFNGLDENILSFKMFKADLSFPDQKHLIFSGKVVSYSIDELSATLDVEPPTTVANRNGFTPKYQRMCRYRVFSRGCGLNKANYTNRSTVTSVNGNVIQILWNAPVVGEPKFLKNGVIFYNGKYRKIMKATKVDGSSIELVLNKTASFISVNDVIDVTFGCDQTKEHCHKIFGNALNYGGFDTIPRKNPFSGVSVF